MPDQPRPVWLTREQRNYLSGWSKPDAIRAIARAWDAAPADAEDAVWLALNECLGRGMSTGVVGPVLIALGYPIEAAL